MCRNSQVAKLYLKAECSETFWSSNDGLIQLAGTPYDVEQLNGMDWQIWQWKGPEPHSKREDKWEKEEKRDKNHREAKNSQWYLNL